MERLDVERLIGSSYADVMIDVDEEDGEVVVRLVLLYDRLFGAMSFFFLCCCYTCIREFVLLGVNKSESSDMVLRDVFARVRRCSPLKD